MAAFPNIILAKQQPVYRTALIGSGWWGMNILNEAVAAGRSRVVALCDVDQNQLKPAAAHIEQSTGHRPKLYTDYRELLEREKPDITIVATPDHWHALPAIHAMQMGSHVYVEKPISHTIDEGRAMVAAQQKYDVRVQVGLHRHVAPHNISGMEFLRSGQVGDIHLVKAFVNYNTTKPVLQPNAEVPAGLDWDFWLGPAPKRAFNPVIHPKGFRNFLDYANGTCGDWGVHWFDQILWWSEEKHPKRIHSSGGHLYPQSITDAPDYQVATFEFENFTATWEHRRLGGHRNEEHNLGVYFYGTKGIFHMGWRDGWTFYPNDSNAAIVHQEHTLHMPDHQNIPELWADFLMAIAENRPPAADLQNSHYATNMSLLAMIAWKVGRSIRWDGERQQIVDDPEAAALMRRPYRAPWIYPEIAKV